MTNKERTRTKYAVAVVAAALVASLALVATVGLTRSEANRREPQGAPPNRPIAGIVGGDMPTCRPSVAFEGQDRAAPQPSARRTAPPTPRPVALDSAPQPTTRPPTQESSPTSRPTEPSATPDEPLGLPEESATTAPTAESDGTLGRRLACAAAACVLAALL